MNFFMFFLLVNAQQILKLIFLNISICESRISHNLVLLFTGFFFRSWFFEIQEKPG